MADTDNELIVLVDEENRQLGMAPKLATHNANTPLHRAFSCYIFRPDGKFLITQRALSKKVFPGIWTNSVCGHPAPGESFEAAIERRANYELNLNLYGLEQLVPKFIYWAEMDGIVEHEFCPIYQALTEQEPRPNPAEVEAYQWLDWQSYVERVQQRPDSLSKWSVLQVRHLLENNIALGTTT